MAMYSYDQVLTDVRNVYEQLTGLPAPKLDVKNLNFPLPKGIDPVALVQSEINYLNLYLINSGLSLRLSKAPTWAPPAEIYETPEEYLICLEIPGLTEKDVSIHIINNTLIARGTRQFRRASEDTQYHISERVYGTFERLFPLPNYVQSDKMNSRLSDGILEIALPKTGAKPQAEHTGRSKKS
ncbi:MAG TPA: Hsp20/alpha crystallin family protein [Blastocatellia bacterium]|nr:Hsp20/alpha crystallin family protein [Blastocatellia bacterium]